MEINLLNWFPTQNRTEHFPEHLVKHIMNLFVGQNGLMLIPCTQSMSVYNVRLSNSMENPFEAFKMKRTGRSTVAKSNRNRWDDACV